MSSALPKPRPGGLAFLFPVLLWLVSCAIVGVGFVVGIAQVPEVVKDFERVDVGGPATVTLEAGEQRIWLERDGIDADTFVTVTAAVTGPDGQEVPLTPYATDLTYSGIDGKDGAAVLTFDAPTDGQYTVQSTVSDGQGGQLAIGRGNPVTAAGGPILVGSLVGFVVFLVALVVLIVMLVKRSRSKKQIRAQAVPAYPGGYGYGAPAPGYGTPPPGQWGGPPPPR